MRSIKRFPGEFPVYIIYIVLFLATVSYPFFWDTIQLASKHATNFYTGGFSGIILPNEIDSGHFPALGIYIAIIWTIFGRTLLVSHLVMLPFVIGIAYQGLRLTRTLFRNKWYPAAALILMIDPTLLAQSTLISPDVLLVFFFLLAVNSILERKRVYFIISLAALTLVSLRGMMCVAGLFISEVVMDAIRTKEETGSLTFGFMYSSVKRKILPYLPAAVIAITFLSWHYYRTGWIGYHKDMPWAEFFEPAGFRNAIFNLFILGWRLADFGRLAVLITGAACIWHYIKNRPVIPYNLKMIMTIFFVLLLMFGTALVSHRNLSGHRYLLPLYITLTVSVLFYLFNIADDSLPKKILAGFMITTLLSGNFWVYPDKIAKGWDSTLAYLPYFHLRNEMMTYMEESGIKPDETGTGFPNEDKFDYISLNGNMNSFADRDLHTNRYIFWSNVYNDFSDDELETLGKWEKVKEFRLIQVRIILYKNPELK